MTVGRGKCESVTACSPLSGPVQRLRRAAVYANTDEIWDATTVVTEEEGNHYKFNLQYAKH